MRERSRQNILEGAYELFRERGIHGPTMGDIARQAGVSKGLPYSHFASRDELLAGVLASRMDSLIRLLDRVAEIHQPRAQLEAFADSILDEVERDAGPLRLLFAVALDGTASEQLGSAASGLQARLEEYLGRLRGLFARTGSREPELDTLLFRSALLGLCWRLAQGKPLSEPRRKIRRRLIELFIERDRTDV